MFVAPGGPSTTISGALTVQVTVKSKGVSSLSLLPKETVPETGEPSAVALQVTLNVVDAPAASEVEPKLATVKAPVTVGGLVSVRAAVPVFVTVIVRVSDVPS